MADIRAVIFDRDGVLADFDWVGARNAFERLPISLAELGQRWQYWGDTYGFPANLEQERDFFKGFWNNLGDELRIPDPDLEKFREFSYAEHLLLFPDVLATLVWLQETGIRVGVLTNFTLASVDESIRALGIQEYVDIACAATVIGVAKPDPQAYAIVMEKMGVNPAQTLFFDDKPGHVAGARSAGIQHAYCVDRSARDHDLPNRIVKDLTATKTIIERLQGDG